MRSSARRAWRSRDERFARTSPCDLKLDVDVRGRRQGLLRAERTPAGQRVYQESDVDRVRFYQQLYAAGLTSCNIAQLLPCIQSGHTDADQRAMRSRARGPPRACCRAGSRRPTTSSGPSAAAPDGSPLRHQRLDASSEKVRPLAVTARHPGRRPKRTVIPWGRSASAIHRQPATQRRRRPRHRSAARAPSQASVVPATAGHPTDNLGVSRPGARPAGPGSTRCGR
ncbi:MerR family transcriptional regulator [Nonomuraea sp. CA-141351]|uniref:MerR family transcriptional regulator n=1 Tax=Nonomuraea sp. CA-141351 TaxID=3239996 RepID=UPI003D8D427B